MIAPVGRQGYHSITATIRSSSKDGPGATEVQNRRTEVDCGVPSIFNF